VRVSVRVGAVAAAFRTAAAAVQVIDSWSVAAISRPLCLVSLHRRLHAVLGSFSCIGHRKGVRSCKQVDALRRRPLPVHSFTPMNRTEPMNRQVVVIALTLTLLLPCHAYDTAGVGEVPCGKVATDLKSHDRTYEFIVVWFQGFISGRNSEMEARVGHGKSPIPDWDAVRVFVENYCGAHPLEPSTNAADALWSSIH
jgi:hypothetical protein